MSVPTSARTILTRLPIRIVLGAIVAVGLTVAACGGDDGAEPSALPTDVDAAVLATDAFAYEPNELDVSAGTVELGILCQQSLPHNIVVETESEDVTVAECGGGEAAEGSIELGPGEYTFFCGITGHREAGMEGTLTVG